MPIKNGFDSEKYLAVDCGYRTGAGQRETRDLFIA